MKATTQHNTTQMRQQHNRSSKIDKSSTNQFDNSLDTQVFVTIPIQPSRRHKPRVKEVRSQSCPQHNC